MSANVCRKFNKYLLVVFCFSLSLSVIAKEKFNPSKCTQEVSKFCPNKKDKKLYSKCIQDSIAKFHNPECVYTMLKEGNGNQENMMRCHNKLEKVCEQNSQDCYQNHRKNFDQSCQEVLDKVFDPKVSQMIESCMGDVSKKCPLDSSKLDDPEYKNQYDECVTKNSASVSADCLGLMGADLEKDDKTKVIEKEKR